MQIDSVSPDEKEKKGLREKEKVSKWYWKWKLIDKMYEFKREYK